MIKQLLFAGLAVSMLISCNSQVNKNQGSTDSVSTVSTVDEKDLGVIVFEEDSYDFGTVKEGTVVEKVFKFKNDGKSPVILAQVSASCGCTTPTYTTEPILPGKEGEVKVVFNSAGHPGVQQKIVTVASNASNGVLTVQLKGTVEK